MKLIYIAGLCYVYLSCYAEKKLTQIFLTAVEAVRHGTMITRFVGNTQSLTHKIGIPLADNVR